MQNQWIYSSTFLPFTGEPIEFRLEEREQAIPGTFIDGVFHSQWAHYGRNSVGSWRSLGSDRPTSPMVAPESMTGPFSRFINRMKSIISRSHGTELIMLPRDGATIAVMTTSALSPSQVITHTIDSNPTSS